MKSRTNVSIDSEILKKAQERQLNVSSEAEKAIREKLKIKEVEINNEPTNCEFCGHEGVKETKETINTSERGLTWLYPDEKWICNFCLKRLPVMRK